MIDGATLVVGVLVGMFYAVSTFMEFYEVPKERVAPDPSLERDIAAAVGSLPPGLSLSVSSRRGPGGRCARIAIGGVCPLLGIAPESPGDIDLGDDALDPLLAFRGPRALVIAMLDGDTRAELLALARTTRVRPLSLTVTDGTLHVDAWRPRYRSSMPGIVMVTKQALALAERLQAPPDVPERLTRNALQDPQRGVRLSNLRTLLREHASEAATRATLQAASAHEDPMVRLLSAQSLGDAGRPVLVALARDTTIDDEASASAIEALDDLPLTDLEAVLSASLRPPAGALLRPFTARACADLLARGGAAAVPLLAQVARSRNEAVGLAGVRALRRIGTVDAVLPLKQAAEAGVDAVREAAQMALDDVQLGLKGTPGAVSLAGAEAGQVSMVEDPAGRVSLPGAPTGKRA